MTTIRIGDKIVPGDKLREHTIEKESVQKIVWDFLTRNNLYIRGEKNAAVQRKK